MRRGRIIAVVMLVLGVGLGAGWYFASPWLTLRQMRAAVEAGDAARLAHYVDFPALREDLKADLAAQISTEAARQGGAAGRLMQAFGTSLADPLVDRLVTPEGLRAALATRDRIDGSSAPLDGTPAAGEILPEVGDGGPRLTRMPTDPVIDRHGIDGFTVRQRDGSGGALVFRRAGLGWKLSGIDLPPISAAQAPAG